MRGYTAPSRIAPQWYVGYLVFQGGNPRLKRQSLTGSGQIVARDWSGKFQPVVIVNTGVTTSLTGSGQIVSRFPFLTKLLGNQANPNGH